jgi:hypothetical protein
MTGEDREKQVDSVRVRRRPPNASNASPPRRLWVIIISCRYLLSTSLSACRTRHDVLLRGPIVPDFDIVQNARSVGLSDSASVTFKVVVTDRIGQPTLSAQIVDGGRRLPECPPTGRRHHNQRPVQQTQPGQPLFSAAVRTMPEQAPPSAGRIVYFRHFRSHDVSPLVPRSSSMASPASGWADSLQAICSKMGLESPGQGARSFTRRTDSLDTNVLA